MKKLILFVVALWAGNARAVDISFDSAQNCTGQPLFGSKSLSDVPCYDISSLEDAQSAIIANFAIDEQVNFYADGACKHPIGSVSESSCFSPASQLGSFEVQSLNINAANINPEQSNVLLSNYTGLAVTSPDSMDIRLSVPYLILGLGSVDIGFRLWEAYDACKSAEDKEAKPLVQCVGGPVAAICGYTAAFLLGKEAETIRGFFRGMNREITNVRRDDLDSHNSDYMNTIMNVTEADSANTYVGSMVRDMGLANHTSPAHEVDMGDDGKWHMSAFFDETTGDYVHHVRSTEESQMELAKRKAPIPYDSIQWDKGGIDFIVCRHNRHAKLTGFGVGVKSLYNTFWDQMRCENSVDKFKKATHVKADIYNEDLVIVASIYMRPYKKMHVSLPTCNNNIPLSPNQDCFIS